MAGNNLAEVNPFSSVIDDLHSFTLKQALIAYQDIIYSDYGTSEALRELARYDRYFLLFRLLHRHDMRKEWLYERCREVEADPDGYLDLWAREHYKSTIITFGGSIQEILRDPEITIGIFSHNRQMAQSFVYQIMSELQSNEHLQALFPDILYANPRRESPSWGVDSGLLVKRKQNPPEKTVEGHGIVDTQPTGRHFVLSIVDDMVHERFVGNADIINKTTRMWELFLNLSRAHPVTGVRRRQYVGTRYHYADTYKAMADRKAVKTRTYPATDTGTIDGTPVFLGDDDWAQMRKASSPHTIACQQLLNPRAGADQTFKEEWLRAFDVRPETINVQILADPATSRKKDSSDSAFVVLAMDAAMNRYFVDGACHKMNLKQRWEMLKGLWMKWTNTAGVQAVDAGYERYGMQCDIEHFEEMGRLQGVSIPITPVSWVHDQSGSSQRKDDRILRLVPDFHNWRIFLPYGRWYLQIQKSMADTKGDLQMVTKYIQALEWWDKHGRAVTGTQRKMIDSGREYLVVKDILRKDHEGKLYNVIERFVDWEYLPFPATTKKDMLDAMSRTYDLDFQPPKIYTESDINPVYCGEA